MQPTFKARDYRFTRGVLAEALVGVGLVGPKKCSYFRVPKLAVNGRCISADFKRSSHDRDSAQKGA